MKVLVTGGAGYIGSHTVLELLQAGHEVVVVDNLSNASEEALHRVRRLTRRPIDFYRLDLRDREGLMRVFTATKPDAIIHFAGLKAVGESMSSPLAYYDNNLGGTLVLLEVMRAHGTRDLVFSSSATVYGEPARVPITEDFPLSATNPYGRTKLMIEEILRDLQRAEPSCNTILLRYFNPVGAHPSGQIGEDPRGTPNNLMPFVAQVAVGRRPELAVFGADYPTRDGTGVRDYIHVVDLAQGHLRALEALTERPGCVAYNLGTGRGSTVLEVIAAFTRAAGRPIPYQLVARRPGDVAECYASAEKARRELGWQANRDLDQMCQDSWRWQSQNPTGYAD